MPTCVACRTEVAAWLPLDNPNIRRSSFAIAIETVGSDLDRFWCPNCRCTDRDRHLLLYLDACGALDRLPGADVLHVAPEPAIVQAVAARGPRRYVRGDLMPASPDIVHLDIERTDFADASFDLVICNHVLEHVASTTAALAEIARLLRPGGRLVGQTPFARRLSTTFEDANLQSPDDRVFFYGQADHVRRFGRDLGELIRAAGFAGRLRAHQDVLPSIDPAEFGVSAGEPFFDFVRDPSPAAPPTAGGGRGEAAALARRIAELARAAAPAEAGAGTPPADDPGHARRHAEARRRIDTGDADGVEAGVAELIALAGEGTGLWQVYAELGQFAAARNDLAAAIDLTAAAVARAPADAAPLAALARLEADAGRRDDALASVGALLRRHPNDAEGLALARQLVARPPTPSAIAWSRLVADLRYESGGLRARLAEQDAALARIAAVAAEFLPKDNPG